MRPLALPLAARDRRRPRPPADTARRSPRGGPLRAGLRRATKRAARARSRSASPHPRTTCARPADRARGVAFSGCRRDGPRSSAARIAPAVGAVAATAEPPEPGARAHADASFPSSTARAAPRASARRLPVPGAAISANTAVPAANTAVAAEAAATTATTTASAASTAVDAPDASAGTAPDDDGYGDDQARLGLRRLESRAHGPAGQRQRQGIAVLSGART
jgi:hypothetical protein